VIDFIDMEEGKNDRSVEKRLRDAVRNDRARIQIGKISQFGLLEMSRQRLRAGVLAGSTLTCPHCEGLGYIRSTESASLQLLRALDEEAQQQTAESLIARAPDEIIIYTLNHKRSEISRIEQAYEMSIAFETNDEMPGGTFEIERVGKRSPSKKRKPAAVSIEAGFQDQEEEEEEEEVEEKPSEAEESPVEAEAAPEGEQSGESNERKRRRRRRRGGRGRGQQNSDAAPAASEEAVAPSESEQSSNAEPSVPQQTGERKRRRRRRGRRGRRPDQDSGANISGAAANENKASDVAENRADSADKARPSPQQPPTNKGTDSAKNDGPTAPSEPANANISAPAQSDGNLAAAKEMPIPAMGGENKKSAGASRKGWWQRKLGI
ncbi:MAG: ribonuclease E/G, partial [Micropepsaceae bacterium]